MHFRIFIFIYFAVLLCSTTAQRNRSGLSNTIQRYGSTGDQRAQSQIFIIFNRAMNFQPPLYQNLVKALRVYMDCVRQRVPVGTQPFIRKMSRQNNRFLFLFMAKNINILSEIASTLNRLLDYNVMDGSLYRLAKRMADVAAYYRLGQYLRNNRIPNNVNRVIAKLRRIRNAVRQRSNRLTWINNKRIYQSNSSNYLGRGRGYYGNSNQPFDNPYFGQNRVDDMRTVDVDTFSIVNDEVHTITDGLRRSISPVDEYVPVDNVYPTYSDPLVNRRNVIHSDIMTTVDHYNENSGVGIANRPFGASINPIGISNGPLRTSINPIGISNNRIGIASNTIGISSNPIGISNSRLGVSNGPFGISNGPFGMSNGPVRVPSGPIGMGSRY